MNRTVFLTISKTVLGEFPRIIETKLDTSLWTSTPLDNWRVNQNNRVEGIDWWKAYTAIKHDEAGSYQKATLENAVSAVSALYIIDLYVLYVVSGSLSVAVEYPNVYFRCKYTASVVNSGEGLLPDFGNMSAYEVAKQYYSNSTRYNAIKEADSPRAKKEKTSNSFEFTSFWADANNRIIPDLIDFTRTFFARHTILNLLTKYCIFTSENMLLVMRPYQITATERILNRIDIATNYKKYGTIAGGGYIWHTTGSGKTLTSFKTARLVSRLPYIDKVLFVVDRKDLDYQTMKEYDRFEKGAANSNTSTAILKKQLENPECKIIITTAQKLSIFIDKNPGHPVYQQHVVIIFDECHRGQFGEMHAAVVKNFKKYHIFGFTGTPIFAANALKNKDAMWKTTEQVFGDQLHTYTIVDAINDKNVLPFRVDYIKTMDSDDSIVDEKVWDIDREKAYMAPERIKLVTDYILNHFDQKTYRGSRTYDYNVLTNIADVASADRGVVEEIKRKQRISGFNAIFCVASIPAAKLYYEEFKKQMEADPTKKLRIATIFSYAANEAEVDGILGEENSESTSALDKTARDFLDPGYVSMIDDLVTKFPLPMSLSRSSF